MERPINHVYNDIAKDFSRTRYKVWPAVQQFIDSLEVNSLVGDIGCGNGKNMKSRQDIKFMGMDLTESFVEICKTKGLDVILGNILETPFENSHFNHTMCIAVVHHLENRDDRLRAISELFRITKSGGCIMIYVWAFEQPENSSRKFSSKDELVPFKTMTGETHYRYYHLYSREELEQEITDSSKKYNFHFNYIKQDYEHGNWYVILEKI